jgi:hypothetical protein
LANLPQEPYSESDTLLNIFQIDLENYLKVKFAFMYHMSIQGREVESWPYWEYEMHVETLSDVIKKKKQAEQQQGKTDGKTDPSKTAGSLMRQASSSMPKMPNASSFKMPKMK